MKGAILNKGEKYHTYLSKIFKAIDNEQIKYNWLITDYICYPKDNNIKDIFSKEYLWITGEELTEIINKEDFQFIWGILSGFSKDISIEEILKYKLPYADENCDLWNKEVKTQHPHANIEIVAWDSTLTLFISKEEKLVQRFRENFPLSEDLLEVNTRNE
ncbi:hypothetical protein JCM1393_20200 [Clostridium carnis]